MTDNIGVSCTAIGVVLIGVFCAVVWPPLALAWFGAAFLVTGLLIDWEAFKHATARPPRRP